MMETLLPRLVLPSASAARRFRPIAALAIGLVLAGLAGVLVSIGQPELAFAMALGIPAAALLLRYPFAAVLIWVLVTPYFLKQLSAEISPALWVAHRLLIPGTGLVVAAYHVTGVRRSPFRLALPDIAIILFLGLGVVNILLSSGNPTRTLVEFYDKLFVPIVLFWLIRATGFRRADLKGLVAVGAWTILVQATIGALAWIAPSVLPAQWLGRAGERTTGTFGGPAPYTITIVFFVLLTIHQVMSNRSGQGRLWLWVLVVAGFLAVFLSLSRGSWLGAGLVLGGLCFVYPRVAATVAAGGVLTLLVLGLGPLGSEIALAQQRLDTVTTVEGRIITNDAALRMVGDRPLIGFGFGKFEQFDEQYKQRVGDIPLRVGGSAHNTYLNMAAELGVPALVLYFVPPVWLLAMTIRLRHRLARVGPIGWRLMAVLWLALLDQFVVSNFLEMIHASLWGTGLWWLTIGILAAVLYQARDGRDAAVDRPGHRTELAVGSP